MPDLGGITHQTVGGFLSTGSAGGSTQEAIEDAIVAIRFVDGRGTVQQWHRDGPRFFALIPSIGLLGVIIAVTFRCTPRHHVLGDETIMAEVDGRIAFFRGTRRSTTYPRFRHAAIDEWSWLVATLRSTIGPGKAYHVEDRHVGTLDAMLATEVSQLLISDPAVDRVLADLDPAATVVDETRRRRVLRRLRGSEDASAILRTVAQKALERLR